MNHIFASLFATAAISLALPNVLHAADPANPNAKCLGLRKERILKRFDANNNGVLDPEEKAAAQKARAERRQKLLDRFDGNGDGVLDDTERQAAKAGRGRKHNLQK